MLKSGGITVVDGVSRREMFLSIFTFMQECSDNPVMGLTPQQTSQAASNLSTGVFQIGISLFALFHTACNTFTGLHTHSPPTQASHCCHSSGLSLTFLLLLDLKGQLTTVLLPLLRGGGGDVSDDVCLFNCLLAR